MSQIAPIQNKMNDNTFCFVVFVIEAFWDIQTDFSYNKNCSSVPNRSNSKYNEFKYKLFFNCLPMISYLSVSYCL